MFFFSQQREFIIAEIIDLRIRLARLRGHLPHFVDGSDLVDASDARLCAIHERLEEMVADF